MLPNEEQPGISMRSKYKTVPLQCPFLDLTNTKDPENKNETIGSIEEQRFRGQVMLDHEIHRNQVWEPLKLFRGNDDNNRFLSATILDNKAIAQKKKELDKLVINAIRQAIVKGQRESAIAYLEQLHFSQSLKIVVRLCNSLNENHLANMVSSYIRDKDSKD